MRMNDRTWNRLIRSIPNAPLRAQAPVQPNATPRPVDAGGGVSLRSLTSAEWRRAQNRLHQLGYRGQNGAAIPVSGHFGPHTRTALNNFRSRNGIRRTDNPMRFNDTTWHRLIN